MIEKDKEFQIYLGLQKKKIRHYDLINHYNNCKDNDKELEVPTTIFYFDEMQKRKLKSTVIKNSNK